MLEGDVRAWAPHGTVPLLPAVPLSTTGSPANQSLPGTPAGFVTPASSLGGLSRCQLFDPLRGDSEIEMEALGPGLLVITLRTS